MKPIAVFSAMTIPSLAGTAMTFAMDGHQPNLILASREFSLDLGVPSQSLQKREDYTCWGHINASFSDCQAAIGQIGHGNQNFSVYSDVCLNWYHDTCGVRFCGQSYTSRPINKTADWLTQFLTNPLLSDCAKVGLNGVMSDVPNINGKAGYYRLYLEHRKQQGE